MTNTTVTDADTAAAQREYARRGMALLSGVAKTDPLAKAFASHAEQARLQEREHVIGEARKTLRLVEGCLECNADDERRWHETIEWLEGKQ